MSSCIDNGAFSFIADIATSKDIVVAAKDVVVAAESNIVAMEDTILTAKVTIDASEIGVEIDREVVESLLVDVRIIEAEVHEDATLAESAATRAEAVVIPMEATYSMDAIDEDNAALINMIWENTADLANIKIEGLN